MPFIWGCGFFSFEKGMPLKIKGSLFSFQQNDMHNFYQKASIIFYNAIENRAQIYYAHYNTDKLNEYQYQFYEMLLLHRNALQ